MNLELLRAQLAPVKMERVALTTPGVAGARSVVSAPRPTLSIVPCA
jgi:hypothetical protein